MSIAGAASALDVGDGSPAACLCGGLRADFAIAMIGAAGADIGETFCCPICSRRRLAALPVSRFPLLSANFTIDVNMRRDRPYFARISRLQRMPLMPPHYLPMPFDWPPRLRAPMMVGHRSAPSALGLAGVYIGHAALRRRFE